MNDLVKKRILHAGRAGDGKYTDGWQLTVHFKVETADECRLIDDTRKHRPLQLLVGKKFKLEILEVVVCSMAVGEVAEFEIDKSLLHNYPVVMKTLRDSWRPQDEKRSSSSGGGGGHCCGMMMAQQGFSHFGYEDLDELMRKPCSLRFTVELVNAESPGSFHKDSWAMSDTERLASVEQLRAAGNKQYGVKEYSRAAASYTDAIGRLETLMLREKPDDEEWCRLNELKLPLLLNLAQCRLILEEFYSAIEHCDAVLSYWPDSVKALYRRGVAHAHVWNEQEARADLRRAAQLDPHLTRLVDQQLHLLEQRLNVKYQQERSRLQGKMFG